MKTKGMGTDFLIPLKKIIKKIWVPVLVAAGLFVLYTFYEDIIEAFRLLSLKVAVLFFFLQLLSKFIIAWQWQLVSGLMKEGRESKSAGLLDFLVLNGYGTILEAATPAVKSGGEGLKGVILVKELGYSRMGALKLIILQKVFGITSFAGVFLIFAFFLLARGDFLLQNEHYILLGGLCYLALITGGIFFSKKKLDLSWSFYLRPRILLLVIISFFIWAFLGLKIFILSLELELFLDFSTVAFSGFLGYGASLLPISPGGLGTYEAAMTFALSRVGLEMGRAFSFTLLSRIVTFWFGLLISLIIVGVKELGEKLS